MTIPLEDNFTDILKAQRGLGISDQQLVEKSGTSAESIRQLPAEFCRPAVDRIAPVLRLDPQARGDGGWKVSA
jgi:hypothetical protein